MHQTQSSRYLIGSFVWKICRMQVICFLLDKSCRKMYTIFSAVLRQQRKSEIMTSSFGHTARSAIYYQAGFPLNRFFFFSVRQFPTWFYRPETAIGCVSSLVHHISLVASSTLFGSSTGGPGYHKHPFSWFRRLQFPEWNSNVEN
jgi:hypothetical protein